MKIVMVHPHDLWSPKEPWTIRIRSLARELKNQGHEITLVSFTLDGFETEPLLQEEIFVHCFSRRVSVWNYFSKIKKLKKIFQDADLIHFQKSFHFCAAPVVLAAWICDKPLHYDWDDDETAIYHSGKRVPSFWIGLGMRFLEWALPRVANSVSVSSEALKQKALKRGVPESCLVKVWVGADPVSVSESEVEAIQNRYGLDSQSQIYIGQLHGAQYVELLLKACLTMKESGVITKTVIVGDGHDRRRLELLSEKWGLSSWVHFVGVVPHEKIPTWLSACRIAIACFENNAVTRCKSPLKIAEYLCFGKAIVAHAVGEVPCMLGDAGLLIDPDDPEGLGKALIKLQRNPAQIEALENKAKQRAPVLRWRNSAENLQVLFQRLYGNSR
jgi:glycosyltransferase involved in cell wall biosynthesis